MLGDLAHVLDRAEQGHVADRLRPRFIDGAQGDDATHVAPGGLQADLHVAQFAPLVDDRHQFGRQPQHIGQRPAHGRARVDLEHVGCLLVDVAHFTFAVPDDDPLDDSP